MAGGPIGFIVGAILIVSNVQSAGEVPSGLGISIAAVVGALVFIAGVVMFAFWNLGILRFVYSDGKRIWLGGAGREFLEQLPELPQETTG